MPKYGDEIVIWVAGRVIGNRHSAEVSAGAAILLCFLNLPRLALQPGMLISFVELDRLMRLAARRFASF